MSTFRRLDATGLPLLLSRLVVGGAFLALGLSKASDPVAFLKLVRQYGLVPDDLPWLLNGLAVSLPWLEVLCGLLLLFGVAVRGTALVLGALLVVFTAAVLTRGLELAAASGQPLCAIAFDCGCGTGVEKVCVKLPENLVLLGLCVVAAASRSDRLCLRRDLLASSRG